MNYRKPSEGVSDLIESTPSASSHHSFSERLGKIYHYFKKTIILPLAMEKNNFPLVWEQTDAAPLSREWHCNPQSDFLFYSFQPWLYFFLFKLKILKLEQTDAASLSQEWHCNPQSAFWNIFSNLFCFPFPPFPTCFYFLSL